MKTPPIPVTDRAVLRYLERVLEQDVQAIRDEIARIVAVAGEEANAGCTGVVANGFRFLLRDGVVTTVVPAHLPDKRTGRCDHRRRGDG